MPIETKDLVIYHAERDTDNSDGGGKYNGQIVADGLSNNLFNDISELDRTVGDVSMRKIFPAVTTNDTDLLMGATVFVSKLPEDPNVSALLFSTESWTDERQAAQNRVENYLAKGGQIAGTPLDTHWQGMSSLQVVMFPQETESSVGDTIVLISDEGKALQFEQYVRITKVENRTAVMVVDQKEVEYKVATYQINDPLERDFVGLSARQWYAGNTPSKTVLRDTLVADTGLYYSSTQLASDAHVGEYTVNADSMFTQLIPSAQSETPIIDINAAGESVVLVPGSDGRITANFTATIGSNQNIFIGSSVMPSSMSFTLFGQSIADQAGLLKTPAGTQVGTIDYQKGHIKWTDSAGTGTTTLTISFTPASAPNQYYQSYSLPVTKQTQAMNYTGVLMPTPTPGALSITYMSQGKFYELKDDGAGQLKGSNPSFGSGMINYETGSWILTTGALPDVDSPIILLWGTPISTFIRSNLPVLPAKFEFDLEQEALLAGAVSVTWMLEGVEKTATSNNAGQFVGDAEGFVNFALGRGTLIPKKLPQKGTVFNFSYQFGDAKIQDVPAAIPNANQQLAFTIGTGAALQPNSIMLEVPLTSALGDTIVFVVTDNGSGVLTDAFGQAQGTVNYTTGAVVMSPMILSSYFYEKKIVNNNLSSVTIEGSSSSPGKTVAKIENSVTYAPKTNPWANYVAG
ncbi:hypothetical protein [Acinetobacter sp. SH20PTE14]|uniref:hypothetical protein n=1 Tax=Acinetobacter sp. SH20PTE14 TaxID=2905879 RepID=UPI001F4642FB|nr:hypothetical protein [Acinetobacter sp. SH20PTE14]UIJ76962.1 hypothetical protein LXF01_06865 [Acinetobacter sp. SH20PTE14]UIJ77025.1 hypothetical protein LXF01_07195 [Acinetobacter sp. SH20PTE14]